MVKFMALPAGLALMLGCQPLFADSSPPVPQSSTGLYGVKVAEPDLAKAAVFYGLLGMQKGRVNPRSGSQEMVWPGPASGSKLSLFQNPGPDSGIVIGGTFMVIQVPDTRIVAHALKTAGFTVVSEPHLSGPAIVAIALDPGGNRIEIVSPDRDSK